MNPAEISKLKFLFSEIIQGFSVITLDDKRIYLKHFSPRDITELDELYNYYYNRALQKNIPTRQQKIQSAYKQELWDKQKDSEIETLRTFISNLRVTKQKMHLMSQIEKINKQIDDNLAKLQGLLNEKNDVIGFCAESFAQNKLNQLSVKRSFFKNNKLKDNLFDDEEFDQLEDKELSFYVSEYNKKISEFDTKILKKVALSNYFVNLFYLSQDNIFNFYGKPILDLTFNQIEVFNHGVYFKNLLSQSTMRPSPDVLEDPDRLIDWFESTRNAEELLSKDDEKGGHTMIVGATKSDLKNMGVESGSNLFKQVEKHGGSLDLKKIAKIEAG